MANKPSRVDQDRGQAWGESGVLTRARSESHGIAGRGALISPGVAGRGALVSDPERP